MLNQLGIEQSEVPKMCLDLYKEYGTTMAGLKVKNSFYSNKTKPKPELTKTESFFKNSMTISLFVHRLWVTNSTTMSSMNTSMEDFPTRSSNLIQSSATSFSLCLTGKS